MRSVAEVWSVGSPHSIPVVRIRFLAGSGILISVLGLSVSFVCVLSCTVLSPVHMHMYSVFRRAQQEVAKIKDGVWPPEFRFWTTNDAYPVVRKYIRRGNPLSRGRGTEDGDYKEDNANREIWQMYIDYINMLGYKYLESKMCEVE